jgi:uncharacterized protein (DUF2147 family)
MPARNFALLALLSILPGVARGDLRDRPVGLWWAEGGAAQVEIGECDHGLCGVVTWLRSPYDENGCPVRDAQNPDARQRDRSMIGVEILRGLEATDAGNDWSGEIYDPTSGRHYSAVVSADGSNRLRVRGYLGISLLGRTTIWTRVQGEPVCRIDD